MSGSAWSYDTIADVYATDMGMSMPFDDIGYYRKLARSAAGPVLELGCGTGRVLLALLADGIDAIGVDRSGPMLARLRRDAEALGLAAPRVAQMDLRALTLQGRFALIMAPYSLVTYLTDAADLDGFIGACRDLLADDGRLVLDAFVPKDVTPFDEFRFDYRRPHGQGFLEREKRIACLADGSNRIERRYRLLDTESRSLGEWTTVDVIRPYPAGVLIAAAARHGLHIVEQIADYEDPKRTASPQFITLILGASL
jgi:SAM-dependent methyltransferase